MPTCLAVQHLDLVRLLLHLVRGRGRVRVRIRVSVRVRVRARPSPNPTPSPTPNPNPNRNQVQEVAQGLVASSASAQRGGGHAADREGGRRRLAEMDSSALRAANRLRALLREQAIN